MMNLNKVMGAKKTVVLGFGGVKKPLIKKTLPKKPIRRNNLLTTPKGVEKDHISPFGNREE